MKGSHNAVRGDGQGERTAKSDRTALPNCKECEKTSWEKRGVAAGLRKRHTGDCGGVRYYDLSLHSNLKTDRYGRKGGRRRGCPTLRRKAMGPRRARVPEEEEGHEQVATQSREHLGERGDQHRSA